MSDDKKRWLTPPGVAARLKSDRAVPMARRLRKTMTPAEHALWAVLRRVAPEAAHFRKQAPLGPFIADFASHAAKLVVEVEGGAHKASDVAARDSERRAWIEGRGYRVVTVRNEDVLADAERVAKYIAAVACTRLE
ncbi:MAG: endonuclease domain-containing protein [Hyphomonadaceae bacterium]